MFGLFGDRFCANTDERGGCGTTPSITVDFVLAPRRFPSHAMETTDDVAFSSLKQGMDDDIYVGLHFADSNSNRC